MDSCIGIVFSVLFVHSICQNIPLFSSIRGFAKCGSEFVPDIKIKLIQGGLFFDDTLSEVITNVNDGSFKLILNEPRNTIVKLYIELKYAFEKGNSRTFYIVNDWKQIRTEIFNVNDHRLTVEAGNLNLGDLFLDEMNCKTFLVYRTCFLEFEKETDQTHPAPMVHVITDSSFTYGVPWATTDTIRIPKDITMVDQQRAWHEFMHTVRHSLDGSFLHFMVDMVQYEYAQVHWCNKRTNPGFAFNEGFASIWNDQYCDDLSNLDHNYEGKVEQDLLKLGQKCHGNKWKKAFLRVLKQNSGVIHTIDDFSKYHKELFNC